MPRVPRAQEGPIERRALPGAPTPDTPGLEAFGAGPARQELTKEVAGLAKDVRGAVAKEQNRILNLQLNDLKNKSRKKEIELLNKIRNVKADDPTAQNVQKAYDSAIEELREFSAGLDRDIADKRVADAFKVVTSRTENSITAFGLEHVENQRIQADNEALNLSLVDSVERGKEYANLYTQNGEAQLGITIDGMKQEIQDYGERNDKSKKWIEATQDKAESQIVKGIISERLAKGNYSQAKQYFQDNEKSLKGKDRDQARNMVQNGTILGEAQRIEDLVMDRDDLNEREKEALARKLGGEINPEVRRLAVSNVKRRINDEDRFRARRQESLYERIRLLQDQDPSVDPVKLIMSIAPDAMTNEETLPDRFRKTILRAHRPPELNDDKAYLDWMEFSADPEKVAKQSRAEWETQFWSKLDEKHREEAAEERRRIIRAFNKKEPFKSLYSDNDLILRAMRDIGEIAEDDTLSDVKNSGTKAKKFRKFFDKINARLRDFQAEEGRNARDLEREKIIDRIVFEQIKFITTDRFDFGTGFRDSERKIKNLTAKDLDNLDDVFDKVPGRSARAIMEQAEILGVELSDETDADKLKIVKAFIAAVNTGDDKLIEAILREVSPKQ